ncbi:MAG: hypothetical protein MZV64_62220 [Ignavibacteriales bacterium]|nr:hypothetical protein [Ignavibacteriales bacterium]
MPAAEKHEVEKIFPESIKAAEKLSRDFNLQIVVSASQNISEEFLFKIAKKKSS